MKYEILHNNLIVSDIEFSDSEIQVDQYWFGKVEVIIRKINNGIVYYSAPWKNSILYELPISQFKQDFSKIVIRNISELFSVDSLISIVQEKECRIEFIEKLSTYFDGYDLEFLCEKMKENNRSEYNNFQESFLETLENETDYKVLKIDTLEKEYKFETIQQQFKI